jgi:methionyl-tRNA formyltransferase
MGTPDFAVESLKALINAGQNIVSVVTAPDKPAGRGKKVLPSPVKVFASRFHDISILQPESLKDPLFIEDLRALHADLQVVVAFRMLPEIVWSMPPEGTINLHASLLPDYRGAAPINRVIMNGETKTGVTTFFIEKDIDTGKIIDNREVSISPEMNAGELHDQLMVAGAKLLLNTVLSIQEGTARSILQKELMTGKNLHDAPKIYKDDCRIKWENSAAKVYNFIRGLSPYPAAWTELGIDNHTVNLKIFKAAFKLTTHHLPHGKLESDGSTFLRVAVHDGYLYIMELQIAGKKRMGVGEFLRGFKIPSDSVLL